MDPARVDRIAKLFAARRLSRRTALATGGAALAATLVGSAAAQEATPTEVAGGQRAQTHFLFVQAFGAGAIAPTAGGDGTLRLTADHLTGQTIYFSDRPERIVGTVPPNASSETGKRGPEAPPRRRPQGWASPRPIRRTRRWSSIVPLATRRPATWSSSS